MRIFLLLLAMLMFTPTNAVETSFVFQQQQQQKISGIILDAAGNPLPFVNVQIKNSNNQAYTNNSGRFELYVDNGEYTLIVSYVGYKDIERTITVANEPIDLKIIIENEITELNDIIVLGKLGRGQAKALNIQKNSPNIKNVVDLELFGKYPDVSAAETVQRLPGVSITRDQGEGEFVQVRGVPEQFNSLTINGQRIPSMEPDAGRSVGLDLVQSYLIQRITLTKALTADMDADAIGGMVDFQLREASKDQALEIYAGFGLNEQESEFNNYGKTIESFAGIASKRFINNTIGVLLAGSYYNTDRGSMFNSRRFEDLEKDIIYRRRITDYDVNRERYGVLGNFDYTPNVYNKWVFTTNYNRYKDNEIRNQARYTWDNTREERRVRNRLEDQELFLFSLKGEHSINKIKLDYLASFAKGKEDLPDRTEFRYRRNVPELGLLNRKEQDALSANSTFGLADPLEFNRVEFEPRFTEENNTTFATNVIFPIAKDNLSTIKTGLKYRRLERDFREGEFRPKPLDNITIPSSPEGEFPFPGLTFTDSAFGQLGFDLSPSDINLDEDLDGYNASEDIFAAYAMNTTKLTHKLTSVIGVRLENTSTDYTSTSNDLEGKGNYLNILPSVHLTYKFNKNNQLRAAYSTGISRPNYTSLVPFESIGEDEINIGNEDLEAINANNFDLMFESYSNNLGFFGIGVFAKWIENQIVKDQVGTQDGLPVFSSINGASASVYGFEVSANQNLNELIGIPISVNANYTFTDSEADFGDGRDDLPLANSPKHVGNLSLIYEDTDLGFFAVIGGVYRHFMFNKFENTNEAIEGNENTWLDKTFHLDLSLGYDITEKISLKLQLNNLTNESNTEVSGKPSDTYSKWTETESYGIWGILGVQYSF